jgi:membrane protein
MALWRLRLLVSRTVSGFTESGGTRLAAAIAYYALLSLFPLVIALVAGAATVLSPEDARREVIDPIAGALPLTDSGEAEVRTALEGAGAGAGAVGVAGLVGLLWTASGMMGAIRAGLTDVTGVDDGRPFLQGKLVDLTMVLLTGALLLLATAVTVVVRVADEGVLGPLGLSGAWGLVASLATPLALTFLVLASLLRFVPAEPIPWAGSWRGALGGSVALLALANGFAAYLGNFGRYNAVYGSLGAIVAVLVFVFLAAVVLLVTAAAASRWDEVARARQPSGTPSGPGAARQVRDALAGLVIRR